MKNLSGRINCIYDIQPKIFLRFNQNSEVGGAAILMYNISDMYIELNIPHNYTFGRKHRTTLACILIHEYCHYIDALTMSNKVRADNMAVYMNSSKRRCLEEQCNWTATKRLAKKLKLWNKLFYEAVCEWDYTTALRF